MFINLPNKVTKRDIKKIGQIYKDVGITYLLDDVESIGANSLELNSSGYFSYVYNVCDQYLILIGNQTRDKDINPNSVNFFNKIVDFEYIKQSKPKRITKVSVPNHILTIMSKQRCLEHDLSNVNMNVVYFITNKIKTHLKGSQSALNTFNKLLCDNERGYGVWEHGLSINTLIDNEVEVLKDTSISGYIIKYRHDMFV